MSEAACLLFSFSSNIQTAGNEQDFADALHSTVKELQDTHKYQAQQKLQGGKPRIYVQEIDSPVVSLFTRWTGAALNPRQLTRLGPDFRSLSEAIEEELMVFPRKDIILGGAVRDEKKLVAARVVRNFLNKVSTVPTAAASAVKSPKSNMAVWIGNLIDPAGRLKSPWELPIDRMGHAYISVATGSGKTYLAYVLVEGCAAIKDLAIVVLDPNNQ